MIYEWRVYEVVREDECNHERFQQITTNFFDKYGIKVVGFASRHWDV